VNGPPVVQELIGRADGTSLGQVAASVAWGRPVVVDVALASRAVEPYSW